jgi:glycosyltransferase involved in cell wall biosynthesis
MGDAPQVVYVVPDKMGGMLNIVALLLAHREADGFVHSAVLTHNPLSTDTRFGGRLAADHQATLDFELPLENLYSVLRRLARLIPPGPGVLVANDLLELALASWRDPGKAVVQILHGDHDYYYDLAARHEAAIDAFVAYSRAMYDNLLLRLPHRAESIHHLPYGLPIPHEIRRATPGPLRLLFAGRLEHGQKGVLELPEIDAHLRRQGIDVAWTVIGDGPDAAEVKRRWSAAGTPPPTFLGALPHAEVLARLAGFDVFVLPTRAEGFPVALLEAMAAGVVPVVSDIASGVPEVVERGETGMLPAVGDVAGFVQDIASLARDRETLERMSANARAQVVNRFDIRDRVRDYQELYARFAELHRPRPRLLHPGYGSRLDQPWLPNALVRALRHRRWGAKFGRS